jgi:hypothetical protein
MKRIRLYTLAQLEDLDRKGMLKAVLGGPHPEPEDDFSEGEEIEVEIWQNPNPRRPAQGGAE